MMEKIRTAANSMIVKVIFGVIILAFIFTGVGGFFGTNSVDDEQRYIAKVDGEGISRTAFESEFNSLMQNSNSIMGDEESFVKTMRRSLLSNQINDYLSYNLSELLNAKISDEQVKNEIRKQTIFFENGRFSNQRYLALLANSGYTPEIYAESIRGVMQREQVMNALFANEFVVPADSNISTLINQNRMVYFTDYTVNHIDNDKFTVTEEEIEDYYENNQQEFFHPARVKMRFVTNFLPGIKSQITVKDDEIKKYYDEGKGLSFSPTKHLYSILTFNDETTANLEYESLLKVKEKSTIKMDSIGWLSLNDDLPKLLSTASLNKINQISKPIEEDGIYYIVRLDGIESAKKQPFKYARDSIFTLLQEEKIAQRYAEQQQKLEAAAKLTTMEEISEASGLPIYETEWTVEKESSSIGRYPEVNEVAFSDLMIKDGKATGNISDIISITEYEGSYIIQVTDYDDAGISPLAEVKETINNKLLTNKKKKVFTEELASVMEQLEATGKANNVSFQQRMTVDRELVSESIDKKTVEKIFETIPGINGKRYGASIIDDETAQIFVLLKTENGEVSDISEQLTKDRSKTIYNYLIKDIRSDAKIEIMPNANL